MKHTGIWNNNYTSSLIKWLVIVMDFVVLWTWLHFVVDFIPHSEEWADGEERVLWTMCTLTMVMAELAFPTIIHRRTVSMGDILRRSTLLVATQTIVSYLLLRVIRFQAHLGWQLLCMGIAMLSTLFLLRMAERWLLMHIRKLGYNTRFVTLVGSDPEMLRLHQELLDHPTNGYRLRSSFAAVADFVRQLAHPDELRLGDELYLCVSRKERALIEQTAQFCQDRKVAFYYVPTADEQLNMRSVAVGNMEVLSPMEEVKK